MFDPEFGHNRLPFFKSSKLWLLRHWRPMPRLVKILFILMTTLLILMTCCISYFWSPLPNTQISANALPKLGFRTSNFDSHNSVIIEKKLIESQVKELPVNYLTINDHFDDNEISWIRDIINSPVQLNERQKQIIEATKHSWNGYKLYSWGYDSLRPVSKTGYTWFSVGLTIIDSLDTLLFMGMKNEFKEALDWIENNLQFHINRDVNCFEMTIRVLGGLLSAFHLTKSSVILTKAIDVGERLIHCFDSPSKVVPFSDVNLKSKEPKPPLWSADSSTSEVSTVQLEFRDLTRITGENIYEHLSFKTSQHLHNLTKNDPLVPAFISPNTGFFSRATITLGARGDSYYEYLLKQYLQTSISWLQEDYLNAIDAIQTRLMRTTNGPLKLTYISELPSKVSNTFDPKMDHLVCFLPGTLILGYYHYSKNKSQDEKLKSKYEQHLLFSESLARTCYYMYNLTETGLAPEIAYFSEDNSQDEFQVKPADRHNLLRPEYVESLFYLYHLTGKEIYREQGWKIFLAFNKYCRVSSGGYTSIENVLNPSHVGTKDMQESFWIAETLKYLFLLFSDNKVLVKKILNNYIFNSEAHLIPRKSFKVD